VGNTNGIIIIIIIIMSLKLMRQEQQPAVMDSTFKLWFELMLSGLQRSYFNKLVLSRVHYSNRIPNSSLSLNYGPSHANKATT